MAPKNDKLQHIIQHAYNNAPAVKAIFDHSSLLPDQIQTVSDLEKVPVTTKDKLVELQQADPPFGGFLAVPFDQLEHVFLSPGPLYEPSTSTSSVFDSVREMLSLAGFKSGDVVLNTFGYHYIPTGLALDKILRDMGATVIAAGVGNSELQIKMMRELGVTSYVGTPSWLNALIQKAEEMGFDFREGFSLSNALVSAEPMPPSLRQKFFEEYSINVTNAYGTAELGFIAYSNDGNMAMRLLETSIVQVANPDTGASVGPGEVGEVVVTTFNETYPLIRLGTGDLAMNVDPSPGKSHQGDRSIILVGRVGDAVKVRGIFIHPNQLQFAISHVPGVERFQAVISHQDNRDHFTLRILAAESADQDSITKALITAVQSTCRIKVDSFELGNKEIFKDAEGIILDTRTWE